MTSVVGIARGGDVWIGGDSAATKDRGLMTVRRDRKVFRKGPFLIGFSASYSMGQKLAYRMTVPKRKPGQTVMEFMATSFIDNVRLVVGDQKPRLLVGYAGRLFKIEEDFQVGEADRQFDAIGAGSDATLGFLHARGTDQPEQAILEALQVAETYSCWVRGPYYVKHLPALQSEDLAA